MKNSPEALSKRNALKKAWKNKIKVGSFPLSVLKKCKDCGETKLCDWMSCFSNKGKPEYKARCKDCHNANIRRRTKLPFVKKARNRRRKKLLIKVKQRAIDFLGGKCKSCGYKKSISALTFHHRKSSEKEFDIGTIKDHAWDKVLNELKKCDLLCFNCHMELHGD